MEGLDSVLAEYGFALSDILDANIRKLEARATANTLDALVRADADTGSEGAR